MKPIKSVDSESDASIEGLYHQTSLSAHGDFASGPSRDAFVNLGELADAAAKDFDWRKIASRLSLEIDSESASDQVQLSQHSANAGSKRAVAWISVCSAAVLLVGLSVAVVWQPRTQDDGEFARKLPIPKASGIDAWERAPFTSDLAAGWNDELDAELAATRRALKQGRDPWMGDEPVLSNVYAQVNELSAGLLFEPF